MKIPPLRIFYVLVKFILLEYVHRIVEIILLVNCRYTYVKKLQQIYLKKYENNET